MEMSSYEPGTPSWVDLGTPDVAGAAAFYGSLFGWDVKELGPEAGGYRMAELRGIPVAGIGPLQEGAPTAWVTYISVSSADATAELVRDAGGQALMPPMDVLTVGRMAVFMDSTGAVVSVWQPGDHPGAGLVNEPGALVWNELTTRSTDDAKKFYETVFGWSANPLQMGPVEYTEWKLNDRTIAGMMPMDDTFPDIPSHWMVYFAVEDADATADKAKSLGGSVMVPPNDIPPGRFAVLNDPAGAAFSIIKMNPVPGA